MQAPTPGQRQPERWSFRLRIQAATLLHAYAVIQAWEELGPRGGSDLEIDSYGRFEVELQALDVDEHEVVSWCPQDALLPLFEREGLRLVEIRVERSGADGPRWT